MKYNEIKNEIKKLAVHYTEHNQSPNGTQRQCMPSEPREKSMEYVGWPQNNFTFLCSLGIRET